MIGTAQKKVSIKSDKDMLVAKAVLRELAQEVKLQPLEFTKLATATSEIARNMLDYAKGGEMTAMVVKRGIKEGIKVICTDQGPGIADMALAMKNGWSSKGSLGLGLPGAKRLVNEFNVESEQGKGTSISLIIWKR
jgi:serine/threonine-protein kinase RsbT